MGCPMGGASGPLSPGLRWWETARAEPGLADEFRRRDTQLAGKVSAEFHPTLDWHLDALALRQVRNPRQGPVPVLY
jgi:hypothetical protein